MKKIPIEISARHVHFSQRDFEKLFGKKEKLKSIKKLSQEDDFAAKQEVELINPNNAKLKLTARILGPFRKQTQVEISITDAHNLKLKKIPPIRVSGNLKNSAKIKIKGPKGKLKSNVIIAQRHLHCSKKDAKKLKLKHGQKIKIKIKGKREIVFGEIVVRIGKGFKLALHLDTDEANAGEIKGKSYGEITWMKKI